VGGEERQEKRGKYAAQMMLTTAMETTMMEKMMTKKINSKSTFYPPQSRKGTGTYSACVLGIRLCYRCHGALVVKELKRA
jgi:hypothetical protein